MTATRPKILVIDDTPENLELLIAALEVDFDLQVATSGALGLNGLAHGVFRGGGIHLEGILAVVRGELVGLLRHADGFDDLGGINHD